MKKILIANRGEIAVRVIRACRDMGIASVAVYSECDRVARHVRMADEAYPIGGNPPGESYLRIDTIIDVARRCGADGIHPGYGFLSENEDFSAACRDVDIKFLGPSPEVIERMGSKTAAREVAMQAGAPVVPGTKGALGADVPDAAILTLAESIGYPLMVKAVAGGGGKGMRVVMAPAELPGAVRAARSEAGASFGDSAIFLERRIGRARHIEVQLLGDQYGTVVPFVERECSLQRRHQKVIEETPSSKVSPELRLRMTGAAAAIARSVGYTSAGTIEFLLDEVLFGRRRADEAIDAVCGQAARIIDRLLVGTPAGGIPLPTASSKLSPAARGSGKRQRRTSSDPGSIGEAGTGRPKKPIPRPRSATGKISKAIGRAASDGKSADQGPKSTTTRAPKTPDGSRKRATRGAAGSNDERQSTNAGDGTPLKIPFGNKEVALRLGARYRTGGWFAPPGANLEPFRQNGWLAARDS